MNVFKKKNVEKIKTLKNVKKRGKNKKRKNVFTSMRRNSTQTTILLAASLNTVATLPCEMQVVEPAVC